MRMGWADVAPIQNDLTAVARAHDGECLLVFPPGEVMGNDGRDIEAALQHYGHLVPGFVHFAAIDALDGQYVEDDLMPVDRDLCRRDAQQRDFAPVAHV